MFFNHASHRPLTTALTALALASLSACGNEPEQAAMEPSTVVVYEGARLIMGDGSAPLENAALAVDQGRIVGVGTAGELSVPAGAARVDLTGMTVMPAIVDAHTHLGTSREALTLDLERRAYFGIAGALSLGADGPETPLEMRSEVTPGIARYRSAGIGITSPEPGRREVHWVESEDAARAAVRTEAARNVDMIKIWVDDRNGQYTRLSAPLYRAVIDEAHNANLKVAAHIFALDDAKELLRAGIDVFAHGVRERDIDDEFVALIKERPNVVLIPNMPDPGVVADLSWLAGSMPAEELAKLQAASVDQPAAQAAHAIQARNLARLANEGVTIALGTDGNTPWAPHAEMADMVKAGMTPADVLVAATRNAAAVAGWDDLGTLNVGKSADFVVLEANPLEDIANTRRIHSVYLRGQVVDRAALSNRFSAAAAPN